MSKPIWRKTVAGEPPMTTPTDHRPTQLTKRWGQDGGLLATPTGICRIPVYLATEVDAQHEQDQSRIKELTERLDKISPEYTAWSDEQIQRTIYLTDQLAQVTRRYDEEFANVDRVWRALGVTSYAQAGGKELHEIVLDLKRQLAAKDAEIELLTTTHSQEISRLHAEIKRPKEEGR